MGRRLALLIATYQYQDTGLRQLTAPAHDAEALAAVLQDPNVAGFEVTTLINESHHRVGEAIGGFYRDQRRDDLTLLYFTGHGLKDDDGRLYLAMTNTRRNNLLFTALSAEQINHAMEGCVSRQKVLILDCCYSGAFPASQTKADAAVHTLERFQGCGRTVLTASDATQYSFEGNQPHGQAAQSVFTRYLVAGLRDGSADLDGDGDITLDELYSYVHDRVVEEKPQQRPKKQDNVEGRIVIAKNINWTLPTYLRNAIGSPIATDRLTALDGLAHLYRIGNNTVRDHVREEIHRLADDDSKLVSATATAHLHPQPPETPCERPAYQIPDTPKPGTVMVSSNPTSARPADKVIPTTGQLPPISPTSVPDPTGAAQPDVSPSAAHPAEPDLPAPPGLNPTTPTAVPTTSGTSPIPATRNRQLVTVSVSAAAAIVLWAVIVAVGVGRMGVYGYIPSGIALFAIGVIGWVGWVGSYMWPSALSRAGLTSTAAASSVFVIVLATAVLGCTGFVLVAGLVVAKIPVLRRWVSARIRIMGGWAVLGVGFSILAPSVNLLIMLASTDGLELGIAALQLQVAAAWLLGWAGVLWSRSPATTPGARLPGSTTSLMPVGSVPATRAARTDMALAAWVSVALVTAGAVLAIVLWEFG